MKDPISEGHALSVILNNFSQPLRGLISTSPARSFIKLIERAEWLEMGLENGVYESLTLLKGSSDTKKSCVTFSVNTTGNNNGKNKRGGRKNHTDRSGSPNPSRDDHIRQEDRISRQNDSPLSSIQLELKPQGRPKHDGWGYDHNFTPLEQPLEQVLEYMITKGMVRLSKIANPPVTMGRFKDQFCQFHRAMGHDTEHCFVFRNIVQDCIDKNLLAEDEKEDQSSWSCFSSIIQEIDNTSAFPISHLAFIILKGWCNPVCLSLIYHFPSIHQ